MASDLANMDKILSTVRKRAGLNDSLHDFDVDLIMEINTALNVCTQLGIGPARGFRIIGEDETWEDWLGEANADPRYEMAKDYIAKRARLKFDPPQVSYLVTALTEETKELEWRLSIQNDHTFSIEDEVNGRLPDYEGATSVLPSFETQILPTKEKSLRTDIEVEPIRVTTVSNSSGGKTICL